jgi:plasmid stabilization system protein ParE
MSYRVVITEPALAAIREQAFYIAVDQQAPEAAARWLRGVFDASDTLSEMPRRCARAPEDAKRPYEIRWLGVGSFVLLFTIVDETKTVWVIAARHSRREPRPDELPPGVEG